MEKINKSVNEERDKRIRKKIYLFFLIALLVFVIDHGLKIFAKSIPGFRYTINTGGVFSLLSSAGWARYLFIIVAPIVLVLVIVFYFRNKQRSKLLSISLPLIFAGTFSNMLDRIFWGYVIDYIPFFSSTFNVADLANTAGVILLIVWIAKKK